LQLWTGNDDLIAGWRYYATLQLSTPLDCLERDGEFSPGPLNPPLVGRAVDFLEDGTGFNPYGIWLRVIDYQRLGVPPPDWGTGPSKRASELGPVQAGSVEEKDLLSFLKSFRYIVETADTLDQMLSELDELSGSTPSNRRIWTKYAEGDPMWPDSYFSGQLLNQLPKGVGPTKVDKLYLAGFRTIEEIHAASDEDLLKVEGIGRALVRKIRGPVVWGGGDAITTANDSGLRAANAKSCP